ncbi:MAG: hypothetical protein ACXWCZ_05725 [Flavisolibacter sp.]
MVDKEQKGNQSDELDLLHLIEKGSEFFKSFGRLIFLYTLIGLSIFLLFYFISPKKYNSRVIMHSKIVTNQEQIEIIETWKSLLKKGEKTLLASQMNIDINVIKKLKDIKAEEVQKLNSPDNPNGFMVDVLVTDTSIFDEIEKGILYGLQNNEYVSERVTTRKATLNQLIEKVKIEIARLDQTKVNVEKMLSSPGFNGSSMMIDVSGIHTQWVALNEKLHSFQDELKFANSVQVVKKFNKVTKPDEPKLVKSIVFGLFVGAFIGYIVALIIYIRRKIKSRYAARLKSV